MADPRRSSNQGVIVDTKDLENAVIVDDEQTYGKKNKPRDQDPSMFQLLSWQDPDERNWDYTTKNKELLSSSALSQFKYKINKSTTNWVTESMDQFRKFAYSPEKKNLLVDAHDPQKLLLKRNDPVSKPNQPTPVNQVLLQPPKKEILVNQVPQKASDYLDKYSIQDLRNLQEVLSVIEGRDLNKNGELVKAAPHRGPTKKEVEAEIARREQEEQELQEEQRRAEEEAQQEQEEEVSIEKLDFTNVKSRILENKVRKAKALDPVKDKERLDRRVERIKRLNETTRWLPNTAFLTYFGRPPFENYGRGNVNPTIGGTIYGNYLKTHNVNPHKQGNKPEFKQVYGHAELAATALPISQPEPPRKCKEDFRLNQTQVEELKQRNPLFPEKNKEPGPQIVKPDLMTSLRFASEENTPDNSPTVKTKKTINLRESLKNLSKAARAIRQENVKKKEDFEQGKRGKSAAPKATKTEESQAEKVNATPQPKKSKAKEETQFVENKLKLEADAKAKSATDPKYAENLAVQKQAQKEVKREEVVKPKPVVIAQTPKKEVKVERPQQASPTKVQFNETASTLNKAATAEVFRTQEASQGATAHEKVWEKLNTDLASTANIDDNHPPKNYLFSLSTKETNPKFYKNVPAVWLNRIPRAGKKNPESENIKNIFNYED